MSATSTNTGPFNRVLASQALMDEMMERCGVNVLELIRRDGAHSFTKARAKCRFCISAMACRQWLLSPGPSLPPAFCPNAELFRGCRGQ
jgi:hypothetical protein